jgi:NAD(P)-dependent dehydrogenase (short-subunit alcohol dehydrogenase family)
MSADRVALVSGAAQGIGEAIATRLGAADVVVLASDRPDAATLTDVAGRVGAPVAADVADAAALGASLADAVRTHCAPTILVANHAHMIMGPFVGRDTKSWWSSFHTNLTGTFNLVQAVLPHMRTAGEGRIVIISSEWGVKGAAEATAYCSSKAGLISLGKTLARELISENIVVNVVAPGVIDTPQLEVDAANEGVTRAEVAASYAADVPLGRVGQPEEVAELVAFLALTAPPSLLGQVLQPNGGTTRCWA